MRFLLLLSLLGVVGTSTAYAAEKPNVLIIMADDCTHTDLPLYGGQNAKTPNLDALAAQSLTFNKAYVSSAMCQPCRAELFTGKSEKSARKFVFYYDECPMSPSQSIQNRILDAQSIRQKIVRIAFEILEDNYDEQEIVIAGICHDDEGYALAERIDTELRRIGNLKIHLTAINLDKKHPTSKPIEKFLVDPYSGAFLVSATLISARPR